MAPSSFILCLSGGRCFFPAGHAVPVKKLSVGIEPGVMALSKQRTITFLWWHEMKTRRNETTNILDSCTSSSANMTLRVSIRFNKLVCLKNSYTCYRDNGTIFCSTCLKDDCVIGYWHWYINRKSYLASNQMKGVRMTNLSELGNMGRGLSQGTIRALS
jgi:hypothetical protein